MALTSTTFGDMASKVSAIGMRFSPMFLGGTERGGADGPLVEWRRAVMYFAPFRTAARAFCEAVEDFFGMSCSFSAGPRFRRIA